jgi:hypothetical protein
VTTFTRDSYDLWGELRMQAPKDAPVSVRVFLSNDDDDRIYVNVHNATDATQAVIAAIDHLRIEYEDDSYTMDEWEAI